MYLDALRSDCAALAAAAQLGVGAKVPSCPAWTMADLVSHVGCIHRWVTEMVQSHASSRLPREEGGGDVGWFEEGAASLVEALSVTADDEPVWNWSVTQPHTAAFWKRRMAHETAVHRWDAQLAHRRPLPIPPPLAKDGIDEVLDTIVPTEAALRPEASLGGSLHLHTTDVPGEWSVRVGDGHVELSYEHGKGDAAVRGTAEDLLLFVWGRKPAEELETFGDPTVLAGLASFSR